MNRKAFFPVHGALQALCPPRLTGDHENARRRDIRDLGNVTAAAALSAAAIQPDAPMLFCGGYSAAMPLLRQLIRMMDRFYVLIGSKKDLHPDACLQMLPHDWTADSPDLRLPDGNGFLTLQPDTDTMLSMKDALSGWEHFVVLCLGGGLQIDAALLDLLNQKGSYILLSEGMNRSVRNADTNGITMKQLFISMQYILVSSAGASAQELIAALPTYEKEHVSDSVDLQLLRNEIGFMNKDHRGSGGGLHFGQIRTVETKPVVSQSDLQAMESDRQMLICNTGASRTYAARIIR